MFQSNSSPPPRPSGRRAALWVAAIFIVAIPVAWTALRAQRRWSELRLLEAHLRQAPYFESEGQLELRAILRQRVHLDYQDAPLREVLDRLHQAYGAPLQVDHAALASLELTDDAPCTIQVSGAPLSAALENVLSAHGLAYALRKHVIVVTTPAAMQSFEPVTRVYPVAAFGEQSPAAELAAALQDLFPADDGEEIRIEAFRSMLIVRAPLATHEELVAILPLILRAERYEELRR